MASEPTHSEAKSKVASARVRVNGRFVSTNPSTPKVEKKAVEKEHKITPDDREQFGSDSKAFFEWALANAATRYEAAKYAKELMRFQYPSLQSMEVNSDIDVTCKVFRWDTGPVVERVVSDATALLLEDKS